MFLRCSWFSLSYTGVYGNVLRVKILYNKKDSALVEYSLPQHAFNGSVITWQIFCFSLLLVCGICQVNA